MSAHLDSLIRKSTDLETQIAQLTAELARLHGEIKAGYLPPRLYDRAVKREQHG